MKLRLGHNKDIAILDVLEDVSIENVSVLRAGVVKLLKSGKDKIIMNLLEAKSVSIEVISAIIQLHLVANELSGEITIVGKGDLVKQVTQGANPPIAIRYFATVEAAMAAFLDDRKLQSEKTESLGVTAELKLQIAKLEEENKTLQDQLKGRNADDFKKIKNENADLQLQMTVLEEQIQALKKEQKKPVEMEAMAAKIKELETTLEELVKANG